MIFPANCLRAACIAALSLVFAVTGLDARSQSLGADQKLVPATMTQPRSDVWAVFWPVRADGSITNIQEFMAHYRSFEQLCNDRQNGVISNQPLRSAISLFTRLALRSEDAQGRPRNCRMAADVLDSVNRFDLNGNAIQDFRPFLMFGSTLKYINISRATIGVHDNNGRALGTNIAVLREITPRRGGNLTHLTGSSVFDTNACPFDDGGHWYWGAGCEY